MKSRKLFSSTLAVITLAVLVSARPTIYNHWGAMQFLSGPSDGGGPVPPWPPVVDSLVADGGGPVPPWPPQVVDSLVADGGGPVPPWPPQIVDSLVADGGLNV